MHSFVVPAVLVLTMSPHPAAADGQLSVKLRPHREPVLASRAAARLNEKIDSPITVDLSDTPLQEALEYVAALQNLRLQLDASALRKDGKLPDGAITLTVKDFPLRVLLKLLLEPVALDWVIRDERLVITSRAIAAEEMSAWQYDVGDLAITGISPADLAGTIKAVVAPQSWQPTAGGSVKADTDSITILQTRRAHRQVQRLLADIRQHVLETEPETARHSRQFLTKRYDVADFLLPEGTAAELAGEITTNVCRQEWKKSGGRGTITPGEKWLEVANERWVHDRLARLLELVGSLGLEHGRNGTLFNFRKALEMAQDIDRDRSFEPPAALLKHHISVDFQDLPQLDSLTYLARNYGVSFRLSDDVRKDVVNGTMVVTLQLNDAPLRLVLDRMLTQFKLDWCHGDDTIIMVARPAEAAARSEVRVHRINELLSPDRGAAELVRKITETIEPDSWKLTASSPGIRVLPGILVIRHNRRTLDRIAEFLEGIHKLASHP